MFQKHIIVGNLGSDPEMRYTPTGQAYTQFPVAADRKWTDSEGKPHEETTWYRIIVWGKQAESCNQFLKKGRRVLVEGDRLRVSPYITREGHPAASLELTARAVRFMDGREGGSLGPEEGPVLAEPEMEELPF